MEHSQFKFIAPIGKGSYGEVWKAKDKTSGKILAIKIIQKHRLNPIDIQSMKDEVAILKSLSSNPRCHQGIVCYYGTFDCDKRFCVAMEYIDGKTMAWVIDRIGLKNTELPSDLLHQLMEQLVETLEFIHAKDIVHRDIKSENVMLTDDTTETVLIDFGFSCSLKVAKNKPKCTGSPGSAATVAPEVLRGDIKADAELWKKADIYSAGVVLQELANGHHNPYNSGDIVGGAITRLPSTKHSDKTLSAIIDRMLNPSPEARPTARKVMELLRGYHPPKGPDECTIS